MAIILNRKNEDTELNEMIDIIKERIGEKSATKAVIAAIKFYVHGKPQLEARAQEYWEQKEHIENLYNQLHSAILRKKNADEKLNKILNLLDD